MHHKPTPGVKAEVEVGVITKVREWSTVRAILEVAPRVDNQSPLVDLNPRGR